MSTKTKHTDDSFKITGAESGSLEKHRTTSGDYIDGVVRTPHGFVRAYSQDDHSNLQFIYSGRLHIRHWNKGHGERGLAVIAGRYAKEIATKEAR